MGRVTSKVQHSAPMVGAMTLRLDGETQVVPIIGDPVAQVKAPALLTARLAARGINAVCVPGHVAAGKVSDFMSGLAVTQNVPGVIFTVPHKQTAMQFCDHMTTRATYAQSVNVIRKTARGRVGENTDGQGYVRGIRAAGGTVTGKQVLLIGAGGAGAAIAYEVLRDSAAHLAVHDIDEARRDSLISRLETVFPGTLSVGSDDPTGFDVVAHATPMGMRDGDPMPVQIDKLSASQFAACAITKPDRSPFIEAAAAIGCLTMPGLGMFQAQEELLVDALLTLEAD